MTTLWLSCGMNHNVGIWIDDKKAVIVSALPERITCMTLEADTGMTLESDTGPHASHDERAGHPPPGGPPDDRYYDEIIRQLGQPDALWIFGPGEAKLHFQERLSRSKTLPACLVGVETTGTLTDPQIVAKVRQHYGIAPPGGSASPVRARSGTQ